MMTVIFMIRWCVTLLQFRFSVYDPRPRMKNSINLLQFGGLQKSVIQSSYIRSELLTSSWSLSIVLKVKRIITVSNDLYQFTVWSVRWRKGDTRKKVKVYVHLAHSYISCMSINIFRLQLANLFSSLRLFSLKRFKLWFLWYVEIRVGLPWIYGDGAMRKHLLGLKFVIIMHPVENTGDGLCN